jgi:glutaredoxin
MGEIFAFCREQCPHSINAAETLKKLKNKYNIKIKYIENNDTIKQALKNRLQKIIGDHSTFPIILYKTSKNQLLLIGGNNDLQQLINHVDIVQDKDEINQLNLTKNQKRLLYYMFSYR